MKHPLTVIWYWGRRGGGADFTLHYARHWIANFGQNALQIELNQNIENLHSFAALGVPVGTTQTRPNLWYNPLGLLAAVVSILVFSLRLWRQSPSCVVITMNALWAWPLLVILKKLIGFELHYIAHDARPHPGDYAVGWQNFTQKRLIAASKQVICLSVFVAQALKAQGVAAIVQPIGSFYPAVPLRPIAKGQGVRFLFLGRLVAYKGLDVLVRAMPYLPPEGWSLTIAGDGPERAMAQREFGAHVKVHLQLHWHDAQMIESILCEHDVLLCPYTEASQSGVIEAAKAAGVRVLAFDVGGLREQIENGAYGHVVQGLRAEDFAQAMVQMIAQNAQIS